MFNFPSERMIPMSESLYDNDQKLKTSHVFKAKMKLDKLAFHRCIAEGLGWSITDFPVVRYAVREVTQPYVGDYTVRCISNLDTTSEVSEIRSSFEIPKEAFPQILIHGLKTIMGINVIDIEIERLWTYDQELEIEVTFKEKE